MPKKIATSDTAIEWERIRNEAPGGLVEETLKHLPAAPEDSDKIEVDVLARAAAAFDPKSRVLKAATEFVGEAGVKKSVFCAMIDAAKKASLEPVPHDQDNELIKFEYRDVFSGKPETFLVLKKAPLDPMTQVLNAKFEVILHHLWKFDGVKFTAGDEPETRVEGIIDMPFEVSVGLDDGFIARQRPTGKTCTLVVNGGDPTYASSYYEERQKLIERLAKASQTLQEARRFNQLGLPLDNVIDAQTAEKIANAFADTNLDAKQKEMIFWLYHDEFTSDGLARLEKLCGFDMRDTAWYDPQTKSNLKAFKERRIWPFIQQTRGDGGVAVFDQLPDATQIEFLNDYGTTDKHPVPEKVSSYIKGGKDSVSVIGDDKRVFGYIVTAYTDKQEGYEGRLMKTTRYLDHKGEGIALEGYEVSNSEKAAGFVQDY